MNKQLKLYSRSDHNIWTDEYIARNLLSAHLDYEHDAASRNFRTIERTMAWIDSVSEGKRKLLDLGCGPGIYASLFDEKGYSVTGMDISTVAIEHARNWAKKESREITYASKNYVKDRIDGKYDIAICIYCDFGALIPDEQEQFLKNVHSALNKDGILILDVFGPGLGTTTKEGRNWSFSDKADFWSPCRHFLLEESVHFENEMAWGRRVVLIEEGCTAREFILWDNYYTDEAIKRLLKENGFEVQTIKKDLIEANSFTSNDVLFVKARKM